MGVFQNPDFHEQVVKVECIIFLVGMTFLLRFALPINLRPSCVWEDV